MLSIVQHHFESNTLKEHLHQALVNIVTVDVKDGGSPKRKAKVVLMPSVGEVFSIYKGWYDHSKSKLFALEVKTPNRIVVNRWSCQEKNDYVVDPWLFDQVITMWSIRVFVINRWLYCQWITRWSIDYIVINSSLWLCNRLMTIRSINHLCA